MEEYNLGFAIGQMTVGILFLWIGLKGFSPKGIPITKNYAIKGLFGKIVGLLLVAWGAFGALRGILILLN